METFVTILHIFFSLVMITVVLFQHGKGASIGATFGGSSQTMFGARGPFAFLAKLTIVVAVGFVVTSILLSVYSSRIKYDPSVVGIEPPSKQEKKQDDLFKLPKESGPTSADQPAANENKTETKSAAPVGPLAPKDSEAVKSSEGSSKK